jgi:hypothetical protein
MIHGIVVAALFAFILVAVVWALKAPSAPPDEDGDSDCAEWL